MSRTKMNLSGNLAPKREKRKTNMRRRRGGEDGGTMGQKNTHCVKRENRKSCEK